MSQEFDAASTRQWTNHISSSIMSHNQDSRAIIKRERGELKRGQEKLKRAGAQIEQVAVEDSNNKENLGIHREHEAGSYI